jgi:hypothetical protein
MNGSMKNAVPTALLVFGAQRGFTMANGTDVDTMVQAEGAVVGGVAAGVVDSTMRGQNVAIRSLATGGILAGGMYAWHQSTAWQLWVPVGALSYLLSDWATAGM